MEKQKYTAIRVKWLDYYIWFETEKIKQDAVHFVGENGWGKRGALTSIVCDKSDIVSTIYSSELQY